MAATTAEFGFWDIVVFVATLVVSGGIGIFYAVKDRRKEGVDHYFFGGRKMNPVLVGSSIAVTFISAITVIGFPVETYTFGLVTIWYSFTLVIPTVVTCVYYIPLIHRLRLNTIYEYLGLRFHPILQKTTSASEMISSLIYMGVTVYLPALALSAVTPITIEWSIVMTSGVCTLYTSFGGIKAVVWTDAVQTVIMLIGALSVLIQGLIIVGGPQNVWDAVVRGGRNNVFVFDPDPRIRTTIWTIMVGFSLTQTITATVRQPICQRYLSCKSVKDARIAACFALVPKIILTLTAIFTGCVLYAFFEGCDPRKSGQIRKADQMMPYMALEAFRNLPGLSGFFVAAAYSGTLSSVSSGINSIGAMFLDDFLLPLWPRMGQNRQLIVSKALSLVAGCMVALVAFVVSFSNETIIATSASVRGAFGGPLLGVYTLGIFVPWSNTKGAFVGQVTGVVFVLWVGISSLINGKSPESQRKLPVSTDDCTYATLSMNTGAPNNFTNIFETTPSGLNGTAGVDFDIVEKTYNPIQAMSFLYYTAAGLATTLVVGIMVSACTGFNDPKKSDPKLFLPFIDNPCLPKPMIRFFRFGVPPLSDEDDDEDEEKRDAHPLRKSDDKDKDVITHATSSCDSSITVE